MEKQLLLKNILLELNELPIAYLKHWYELIHTFNEKLPVKEDKLPSTKEEEFDWDVFVVELMANRRKNNIDRFQRIEKLLEE